MVEEEGPPQHREDFYFEELLPESLFCAILIFLILIWHLIFVFPFHKERPKFPPVLEIFIKFSNCKDSRKSRPWEFLKTDRNRWESGKVLELIYFVQQMKPYFPNKLFTCSSELTRRFFSDKIRDSFGLATDSCISVFLCSSRRFETGAAQWANRDVTPLRAPIRTQKTWTHTVLMKQRSKVC